MFRSAGMFGVELPHRVNKISTLWGNRIYNPLCCVGFINLCQDLAEIFDRDVLRPRNTVSRGWSSMNFISQYEEALDALNGIASNVEEANWSVKEVGDINFDCRSQKC